jgi:hypothetical protein
MVMALEFDYKMATGKVDAPKEFYPNLFYFLNSSGQHLQAYELLFKPVDFSQLGIDKKSFIVQLPLDTVRKSDYSSFRIGYFDRKHKWIDTRIKDLENTGP